ncbi:TonB-dependent copper receptor [Endozoicomonas sp. OPT23]|uniref:TonB-dependent copper receptor n=1 Tax=Endozoicomonas sp. OPT23 TaxID=2072845 RepID=UPI00129AD18D|nr:TonB-dependent copper receptor [Endozoicomonas sp. OPT23]MRI32631.1 TonB-dependent copper receptor [Endozoicomonas sp. OPT23]
MLLPVFKKNFLLLLFTTVSHAGDIYLDVDVTDNLGDEQSGANLNDRVDRSPVMDAGKLLELETGVSAARKAGRGFEPIIRGQQQSQLNILLDGTYLYGACPGRMDPPSSYVTPAGYDRIKIIHGFESVLFGAGGAGGTVLFERDDPVFDNDTGYTGSVTGNYSDNSDFKGLTADLAAGNESGFLRAYGAYQKAGNYRDGSGETVSSAFKSLSGGLLLALDLTDSLRMEVNAESSRDDDIHYAGSAMDAPWAKSDSWRLRMSYQNDIGWFDGLEFQAWLSKTEHLMDNYSVRKRPDVSSAIRTPSEAESRGARFTGSMTFDVAELKLGADFQQVKKVAQRYKVNTDSGDELLQANIWPEIENRQFGVFSELDYGFSATDSLRVGLRIDDLNAETNRNSSEQLGTNSPDSLYRKYYGETDRENHKLAASGLLSWQHVLSSDKTVQLKLSRNVRQADATERYVASRGSCCQGSDDWVGNPDIKPEVHHQLDIGYQQNFSFFDWSVTAWLNEVSDYILRYESESGAYLYGNRDARLYGLDSDIRFSTEQWQGRVGLSWLRGENKTDNKPLPQMPPLSLTLQLDYLAEQWLVGGKLELASGQDRVDKKSGLDAGSSTGYGVFHLYGKYELTDSLTFNGGVKNLFNKTYAPHINRASRDPFNPQAAKVNEPGREIWLSLTAAF